MGTNSDGVPGQAQKLVVVGLNIMPVYLLKAELHTELSQEKGFLILNI